jgi:hypothetical protein
VLLSPSSSTTFTNVLFTNNAADEGEAHDAVSGGVRAMICCSTNGRRLGFLVFASLHFLGSPLTACTRFSPRAPWRTMRYPNDCFFDGGGKC